jgi:hypothetical protein
VTARTFRIELRRSWAPLAAVVLVAITLLQLYATGDKGPWMHRPAPWDEQWVPSALWIRFMLILTFPIAFGAGAVQGRRDERSGMVELLGTVPRSGRTRGVPPAAALALAVVAGYSTVQVIGLAQVVVAGGYFSFAWLPIALIGLLAVVAAALLGLGIGRVMPHPVVAPIGTVLVFALVFWLQASGGTDSLPYRISLLGPALAGPRNGWVTLAAGVDLGQAVWFGALAVTGFVLLVADSGRLRAAAAVPVLVGAAVALAVFPAQPSGALVAYSAAEPVCSGPVCVTRLNQSELTVLAGPGRQALERLAQLDDPPRRVAETTYVADPDGDRPPRAAEVVAVDFDSVQFAGKEGSELERALVAGAGVPQCTVGWNDALTRERAAQTVAAAWFMGDLEPVFGESSAADRIAALAGPAWRTFHALPPAEQARRINALRAAALSCRGGDLLGLLTGVRQ